MPVPIYNAFYGLKSSVANPTFNSAQSGKNFLIHKHREPVGRIAGWIELADGYVKKNYVAGCSTPGVLPANDTTIRKISSISVKDIYNLYIPDHGGQNVTVVVATYTKTGFFPASPTVNRFGIWIRPYWNGSAWTDAWYEVTEMFIFELVELGTGGNNRKLYIDDAPGTKYNFKTLDPTGTVFTTDYFKNWTIVYSAFGDSENYDLVASCGYDTNQFYLQLVPGHLNTQFSSRTAGTKLLLYRAFLTQELPSSLSGMIYGVLSEMRMTSGNSATDIALMLGNRSCSFYSTGTGAYTRTIDGLIGSAAFEDLWQLHAFFGIRHALTDVGGGETGLPVGWFYFRQSIVFDDGNETRLHDAATTNGWGDESAVKTIEVLAEGKKIQGYLYRSWGALPLRARYMRVYMSSDNINFYRVKDYDLRDATLWDDNGLRGLGIWGGNHWYAGAGFTSDLFITGDDWDTAVEATTQIGRQITDSGIIQFKHAAVVGRTAFAVGVRAGGTLYPNHMFASLQNGDGGTQYDVFGLVSTNLIGLEYNDGDELVADHGLTDRVLAFKRRSAVLVSQQALGSGLAFTRDVVSKSDGLCSVRTIVDFEDVVYWAGYYGIYSFSSQGMKLINQDWLEEWKAVSTANKEAAIAVFDRTNHQFHLSYASVERMYDIDTGEWVCGDLADQPSRFAANQRDGTVDFLSGSYIQTLAPAIQHDGAAFTMEYQFNDLQGALEGGINMLLINVKVRYSSSVPISAQLYKDGSTSGSVVTLPAAGTEVIIPAGLSFRCKRASLKLSATTTADAQAVQIKEICPRYQIVPAGVTTNV